MRRLANSFACALLGIWRGFKSERNFRIELLALVVVIGLGLVAGLSAAQWGPLILAMGMVLAAELINTAVERLGDEVADGRHNQRIGHAKDLAAAGVFVMILAAVAVGIMFLIIPLVKRVVGWF